MNTQLLKSYIMKFDGTQLNLAKAMGISLSCLNAKLNGAGGADFRQSEISFIKSRYGLTEQEVDSIFFSEKVS